VIFQFLSLDAKRHNVLSWLRYIEDSRSASFFLGIRILNGE